MNYPGAGQEVPKELIITQKGVASRDGELEQKQTIY